MLGSSLLCFATMTSAVAGMDAPTASISDTSSTKAALSADRMVFIPNQGQWDHRVRFLAKGNNVNMWVTNDGLTYEFYKTGRQLKRHVVRVGFAGSNSTPQAIGFGQKAGELNFMTGRDRSKWATHVPIYKAAKIAGIYRGIDLVTYFDQKSGLPRYDLVAHPGADTRQIAMRYSGGSNLRLTPEGTVAYNTSLGVVRERNLVAYQGNERLDGTATPGVACAQTIDADGLVRFRVGKRDRNRTLVIDPLIWSTFLGGTNGSAAKAVAFGPSNTLYVAGDTRSSDFPTTVGAFQTTGTLSSFGASVFLVKLDASTTNLIFGTYLAGSSNQTLAAMALDSSGNAYLAGGTSSSDFPTTAGSFQSSQPSTAACAFVDKLSADGSTLMYGTYVGGTKFEDSTGIAVDSTGAAYLAGITGSNDLPTTAGSFQPSNLAYPTTTGFIVKLDPAGANEVYGAYIGGTGSTNPGKIAVDSTGAAYLTGATTSTDFPTSPGAYQTTFGGFYDAFVTKVAPDGGSLTYSTFLGGSDNDQGKAIVVDGTGAAYVGGSTFSPDFVTTVGTYQPGFITGGTEAYITKLDPTGGSVVFSTFLGDHSVISGICLDPGGQINVIGACASGSFPTTNGAIQRTNNSDSAIIVSRLSPYADQLLYSTYLSGFFSDFGNSITTNGTGTLYIAGSSSSPDFYGTPGAYRPFKPSANAMDAFVTAITPVPGISLSVIRSMIPGGVTIPATVTLAAAAPTGGTTVTMASSSSLVTVPHTVVVPAGSTAATFNVVTQGVDLQTPVLLTGTAGTERAERTIVLQQASAASLMVTPTIVWGGSSMAVNGKVYLNGKAGPSGVDISIFSTDSSVTPPATVHIAPNGTMVQFPIAHSLVAADTAVSLFASPGGGAMANMTVKAIKPISLTVSPSNGFGGASAIGQVNLNYGAPVGGMTVTLNSSSANATVPASVVVPAGAHSATFNINTVQVAADEAVTISAVGNGATVTDSYMIRGFKVSTVSLNPTTVVGGSGTTVTFTVNLNVPAPAGGLTVNLASSTPTAATVPATLFFAAGQLSLSVNVTHFPVPSMRNVSITATLNGASKGATLKVTH